MGELVGVIDSLNAFRPSFLKRTALLFDKIALPLVGDDVMGQWIETNPVESNELLWLIDQGIVFEVTPPKSPDELSPDEENQIRLISKTLEECFLNLLGGGATAETPPEKIKAIVRQRIADPTL